jgi:hypothetical protein
VFGWKKNGVELFFVNLELRGALPNTPLPQRIRRGGQGEPRQPQQKWRRTPGKTTYDGYYEKLYYYKLYKLLRDQGPSPYVLRRGELVGAGREGPPSRGSTHVST